MAYNQTINHLYEAIGQRIKNERINAGYKQNDFAELLQISRTSLVNIEKGKQRPPVHFFYELSRILNKQIIIFLPQFEEFSSSHQFNIKITEQIIEKSKGNSDIQEKLFEFVKTNSIGVKSSL